VNGVYDWVRTNKKISFAATLAPYRLEIFAGALLIVPPFFGLKEGYVGPNTV